MQKRVELAKNVALGDNLSKGVERLKRAVQEEGNGAAARARVAAVRELQRLLCSAAVCRRARSRRGCRRRLIERSS